MKHDFFESIDTEAKAYWLGFLFADGNVSQPSSGRSIVTLSQKEADVPASFLTTIDSQNKVNINTNKNGTAHRAQISSQKMVSDLIALGCTPAKSLTLSAPLVDLGVFTRDFIRGYNDGDGGFYQNPSRMRMRGTLDFLSWIKSEIPPGSLLYPNGPTAQLFVCKRQVLSETVDYLYGGATIFLARKHDVAMKLWSLSSTKSI